MNYSNMIDEKHLKKGFIIATLISTVVGTFTASMTLHDKIQEKRDKKKQAKLDSTQSAEIKKLKESLEKLKSGGGGQEKEEKKSQNTESSSGSSRSSSSSPQRRRRRRYSLYDDDAAYLAYHAGKSRALIEQTYEDNLMRMGSRYARGDLITENALQAQIISLQQTVINVLQDALYNNRSLTEDDMRRLLAAQNAAREGSLEALQGQYDRMRNNRRSSVGLVKSRTWDVAEDKQKALPAPVGLKAIEPSPPQRVQKSLTAPPPPPDLFCRYSTQLQTSPLPLHSAFAPSGSHRCPACQVIIPISTRDIWVFSSAGHQDYSLSARFVAKCHIPDGRFACVLCAKYRDRDCICRDVEALVKHVGAAHGREEIEGEGDVGREGSGSGSGSGVGERGRELVLA